MLGRTSSAEHGNSPTRAGDRLASRRRLRRRRIIYAFCILFLLLFGAAIYGLQQNSVRISLIQVFGADNSLSEYATQAMQGNYLGIIPRDSIFFFPEISIRADILAEHPEIAAVSIFRNGLTSLSIKVDERIPIARWCGLSHTEDVEEYCYFFDAKGYIFAAAATTTQTINSFSVYVPLEGDNLEPLRATISHPEKLPSVFDFARQLSTFGSPVTNITFRGDEVDDYLESGTRITYVLGDEQNAFTALVSANENLNLADGSIEYVDVRFDGKVYLKKKSVGSEQ